MSTAEMDFDLFRIEDRDGWQKVASRQTHSDRYIQIEEAEYLTPGRREKPVPWTVAHVRPAIAVAPMLEDGRYVLISQERLPVQRVLWEFPAGQIDEPGGSQDREIILATVLRELREETGCELAPRLGRLEPLGWFLPSQGFSTEHVYLFRAGPVCVVSRPQLDGSEHISDMRFVSAGELRRMVAENEITNALTLALFARMSARGWL